MLRLVRIALLVGAAACAAVVIAPPPAVAGVARLEPVTSIKPGELPPDPALDRIVVTDERGARRTLGPVPSGRLFADPGGRHLLTVPSGGDAPKASRLVPLDGSASRPLRLPAGTMIDATGLSQVSWTPDGTELLIGHALGWDPSKYASPSEIDDIGRLRWVALRCPIATAVCSELPASSGFAIGIPNGLLTTSSVFSTFPISWLFEGLREVELPAWERPTSRRGRTWIGIAENVRTASTQLVGPPPTALGGISRSGAAGIPAAIAAAGGPAGAVFSSFTFVTELERRRGKVRLDLRIRSPRLVLATPGAPLRTLINRPITLARRDRRRIAPIVVASGEPLHFHPQVATTDGWLGGGSVAGIAPTFVVLATMDATGRVRPVTVHGRSATAWNLLRAALGRSPRRVAGAIEFVGYEATGHAIVTVEHGFGREAIPTRFSTLRVPLDGKQPPTIVRERVDAAW